MVFVAFIGGRNGDEGKGKITDDALDYLLSQINTEEEKILVYRYQGGPNAGHSVYIDNLELKLHQLPSGIAARNSFNLAGTGMLINPRKLVEEINTVQNQGVRITPENYGISSKAHMILDYHVNQDQSSFNLKEHHSTGNGIKQAASDKAARLGIRFGEFLDEDLMANALWEKFPKGMGEDNSVILPNFLIEKKFKEFSESYSLEREFLKKFLVLEQDIFKDPKYVHIIGEGAQGVSLGVDNGQYPGTSSTDSSIIPGNPEVVIGVFKAYESSVGIAKRPFISEMDSDLQAKLINPWCEYGVSTGKPRHIGWFDAVAAKYSVDAAHMNAVALTCVDRLEELGKLGEKIKVTVAYEIDDKKYDSWQVSFDNRSVLAKAKPIYKEFDSWTKTTDKFGSLTPKALAYKNAIQDLIGVEVVMVGTGPKRKNVITYKTPLQIIK